MEGHKFYLASETQLVTLFEAALKKSPNHYSLKEKRKLTEKMLATFIPVKVNKEAPSVKPVEAKEDTGSQHE